MSASNARAITVVLPFAPQDQEAHDRLVAAACALRARADGGAVQVIQCVPPAVDMEARGAGDGVDWWNLESPHFSERSAVETLAGGVCAALDTAGLASTGARLIVTPASSLGEELAALLAARLGAPVFGRCIALALQEDGVVARRMAFGGRLVLELRSDATTCCAAWRPQGEVPGLSPLAAARLHRIVVDGEAPPAFEAEVLPAADGQARLEGARVVVGGGRGMAGPEGFDLLSRVAACLGGSVGGSLPAVDAGWVPVARQVGQSGKFVSPQLYFAVAISGTPQHLAGVAGTTRIVAVNQDPDAPIFAVADVGVVADWRELLPMLVEHLESVCAPAG